jgi:hypothetical protein
MLNTRPTVGGTLKKPRSLMIEYLLFYDLATTTTTTTTKILIHILIII